VTVRVPLLEQRDASYDIVIGRGLLAELGTRVRRACPARRYALVTDDVVDSLYAGRVLDALRVADLAAERFAFPAGEAHKSRETWARLSDALLGAQLGRDSAVIALGGGVVGDVAGFVAATYLRGIPYVQVPTTLLAMLDSSIGGKTAVDVPSGKNLIGAFHQPCLVVADLEVLRSLPRRELAAGLAEAIKHGVIADAAYFETLEATHARLLGGDLEVLEPVVARSVEIKAEVVAGDEREGGRRAILNFGHTVAHAIEATSQYAILHGDAVAIGMVTEARIAEALGLAPPETSARIARLVTHCGLPRERPLGAGVEALVAAMYHDKKTRDGVVRFSLPRAIGAMRGDARAGWTVAAPLDVVRAALDPRSG